MGDSDRPYWAQTEEMQSSEGEIRRGLVLSGGGMRLSYQAGAIQALFEAGLKFGHIDATSGGSLNMSMLLSGQTPGEMCEKWRNLELQDSISFLPIKEYLDVTDLEAIAGTTAMREKVLPALGIDINRIKSAAGATGCYNVLNFTQKKVRTIDHSVIDEDMLVAGMSLPGVMPPLERDGDFYLDSAFVKDANLLDAVYRGCNELWVIWGLGNTPEYRGGMLRLYIQMLEMSANGALNSELEQILDINRRIVGGEKVHDHSHPIRVHIIKPGYPLPLDPDLYAGKIDSAMLIDMGYSDAREYLSSCTEDGVELDHRATQQSIPRAGIILRFGFEGHLTSEGVDIDADTVKRVRLRVAVRLHDLDRFIEGTRHESPMVAHIRYLDSGDVSSGHACHLRMFSKNNQFSVKSIEYRCQLKLDGDDCYLMGEQRLKDDPGFDLVHDLSTLYVTVHKGEDSTAPVSHTGILKLKLDKPSALAAYIHPIETTSLGEASVLISKFMRFYLGELFDTYF